MYVRIHNSSKIVNQIGGLTKTFKQKQKMIMLFTTCVITPICTVLINVMVSCIIAGFLKVIDNDNFEILLIYILSIPCFLPKTISSVMSAFHMIRRRKI